METAASSGHWRGITREAADTIEALAERVLTPVEAHELFSMYMASGLRPPEIHPEHPLVTGANKLAAMQADDPNEGFAWSTPENEMRRRGRDERLRADERPTTTEERWTGQRCRGCGWLDVLYADDEGFACPCESPDPEEIEVVPRSALTAAESRVEELEQAISRRGVGCRCKRRCGDVSEGDDDPRAVCRGLPRAALSPTDQGDGDG
ncbi:MAG: hypothetical protein M3355_11920 [Actinomycetota bacterium]|nr:hypothetical protein [Actinomycetota bacterium]